MRTTELECPSMLTVHTMFTQMSMSTQIAWDLAKMQVLIQQDWVWGLRFCFSSELSGYAGAVGNGTTVTEGIWNLGKAPRDKDCGSCVLWWPTIP